MCESKLYINGLVNSVIIFLFDELLKVFLRDSIYASLLELFSFILLFCENKIIALSYFLL